MIFGLFHSFQHHLREVFKGVSPYWDLCQADFLEQHPTCAACGGSSYVAAHHIEPIDEFNECDWTNLIALCAGKHQCHLRIGHAGKWGGRNPNVVKDAEEVLAQPALRPLIEQRAADAAERRI